MLVRRLVSAWLSVCGCCWGTAWCSRTPHNSPILQPSRPSPTYTPPLTTRSIFKELYHSIIIRKGLVEGKNSPILRLCHCPVSSHTRRLVSGFQPFNLKKTVKIETTVTELRKGGTRISSSTLRPHTKNYYDEEPQPRMVT